MAGSAATTHHRVRREEFFTYFRARAETAGSDDLARPERMLLLTACLDALAKHWGDTCADPETSDSHADRMHRFLRTHGGHPAFARVAAPLLYDHLTGRNDLRTVLERHFPFERYRQRGMCEVATWEEDPEIDTLSAEQFPAKHLADSSYGGVLYKRLRCAWVHEFAFRDDAVWSPENDRVSEAPFYRHVTTPSFREDEDDSIRAVLMIPEPFLRKTLANAVASFADEADRLGVLPFQEKR